MSVYLPGLRSAWSGVAAISPEVRFWKCAHVVSVLVDDFQGILDNVAARASLSWGIRALVRIQAESSELLVN